MKTFREFVIIAETAASESGKWRTMNDADFEEFAKKMEAKSPQEADNLRRLRSRVKARTNQVSSKDVGFGGKSTQATPNPSQQPAGTTPPPPRTTQQPPQDSTPPKPQKSGGIVGATERAAAAARPGLRTRLGNLAGPAVNVATAAMDYKERRSAGQSRQRAAGGALSSLAGYAKGAQLGAQLGAKLPVPLPMWAKAGGGALIGGSLGSAGTQAAYDYAVDKTRPARQAVAKATGFDKFQQTQAAFKPGSGLSGLEKARQTVDTRAARQVAAKAGTYGARQGSAIVGPGTPLKKPVTLPSTQLVRDPKTGQQRVGDLAYRTVNGQKQATYLARPSVSSRDTSLAARVGRALNIGRYSKAAETQAAKQEYRTALKGTQQYQKQLGITPEKAKALKLPGR